MEIITVIGLIILGLLLIYVELFLLPGTFIVGILGGIAMVVGVYLSYNLFDVRTGNYTMGISLALFLVTMVIGYKKITSKKWTLNAKIEGKVKIIDMNKINVGDRGKTISMLRPAGKVMINGERMEAHSIGELIENNIDIEVTKVEQNKIIVKPVKKS